MSTLEDAAQARKARLLALKSKKRKAEGEAETEAEPNGAESNGTPAPETLLAHRSYDRATGQSRKHVAGDEETVETAVEGLAARIVADDAEKRAQELDLTNIQPKKPNWDLKRDVEKKLEKLKPIEQSVIAELIRARIKAINGSNGGSEAEAATLAAAVAQANDVSDDDD